MATTRLFNLPADAWTLVASGAASITIKPITNVAIRAYVGRTLLEDTNEALTLGGLGAVLTLDNPSDADHVYLKPAERTEVEVGVGMAYRALLPGA
ncbi:hypothetical protein [Shinella sp. DD12]|uniref:hypothetical protein n=1 Tax=Shinella sp. DD12 TaxID=1410620 RepID=UPI000437AC80|nr:hypothetical protein [Shinella sp. DD12]EYR81860.1 hypothetical protein SHLA_4c001520 [Shinella sp. DD12]